MRYSDNYNLKLPQRGVDRANVDDLDSNFEAIDGALADDRQIGLLMYDSSATYNTGAIRGYENPSTHRVRAYRCLEDNVTGPWDATKWAQTTLAAEIENGGGGGSSTLAGLSDVDLGTLADGEVLTYDATEGKWVNAAGGSGGASELSDLDDVTLTTPTDGQILTYDGDEWVNTDAPDVDVTKTAEGNPIEISDGADAPLVKCVSAITGSQDLHGYDKPWVGGAGKNKLDNSQNTAGAIITSSGAESTGQSATYGHTMFIPVQPNTTYTWSGLGAVIDIASKRGAEYSSNSFSDFVKSIEGASNTSGTFTTDSTTHYVVFNVVIAQTQQQVELGSTATSFAPYSNICPISGYSEIEVNVRGFNIFDEEFEQGGYNSTTGAKEASGASTYRNKNIIPVSPNRAYYFYCDTPIEQGDSLSIMVCEYDISGNYIGCFYKYTYNFSFTTGAKTRYINFRNYNGTRYTSVSDVGNTCINLSDASKNGTYEPYNPNSKDYTISLGSTRYGGTLDVVRGVLRVTHKSVTINGDSTYTYQYNGSAQGCVACYINLGDKKYGLTNFILDKFFPADVFTEWSVTGRNNSNGVEFHFPDSVVGTQPSDFATWFSNNNTQIVYELATPTTLSVTPTNLPIKSLSGYTHIESTTGDMEIEYITSKYQPIVDLIQSSKHVYSTAEQVVGTWIDGKTLYEKTLTYNQSYTYSNSGWGEIPFTGVPSDIETAISLDIIGGDDDGMQFNDNRVRYMVDLSGSSPKIVAYSTQANHSVTWITAIIRYTKSASQSRSVENLSKGGEEEEVKKVEEPIEEKKEESSEPISEPLETKTDSLSKDETELKEEDESKEIEEVTEEPEEEPTEEEPEEEPVDPEPSKEEEADER